MTTPVAMAVTCQTCHEVVWRGDVPVVEDGEELLRAYAPGHCPRQICPHKPPEGS